MRQIYFSFVSFLFLVSTVYAATFNVVGNVRYGNWEDEILVNNIEVRVHKVGDDQVWQGALSKDGERVNFNFPVEDLSRNDQLIVTGEVNQDNNDVDKNGFFGGVTTVLTDQEVGSGLVGELVLELNPIPVPEFDSMTDESIKMCWKGMNDFSVVGYEVYRTNELFGDWDSVGKAGQSLEKQVCFTDVNLDLEDRYYYRLAVMTSWSAGEGREFFVSNSESMASDGVQLGLGVVDVRGDQEEDVSAGVEENDFTQIVEADSQSKKNLKGFWNVVSGWLDNLTEFVELNNLSWELVIIVVLAAVLLLVVLIFVVSLSVSNKTSKGSVVWAEGDLDLEEREKNDK